MMYQGLGLVLLYLVKPYLCEALFCELNLFALSDRFHVRRSLVSLHRSSPRASFELN